MTAAVVIECEFDTDYWNVVGNVYICSVRGNPSVTSPGVTVTSVTGDHEPSMSHADVQGFYSYRNTINFMPCGLNDVFPNLIGIEIGYAGMKELHQSDLKQFPRLRYLGLYGNVLTIIEQDLFKFNTELEYISFGFNRITQIHPTVFDHLNKLSQLHLDSNVCMNKYAENRSAVEDLISSVKRECLGDFTQIDEEQQASKQSEAMSKVGASEP
jgi:hypothetical protein